MVIVGKNALDVINTCNSSTQWLNNYRVKPEPTWNSYNIISLLKREDYMHSYNKSQRDAQFLKFILVKNSTCFGQIYCPSSGVSSLYTQQLVFVMLKF